MYTEVALAASTMMLAATASRTTALSTRAEATAHGSVRCRSKTLFVAVVSKQRGHGMPECEQRAAW